MADRPLQNIRLYRFRLSGHAHRVELFLSLLRLPFERIEVDLRKGEHKQPAFLAKNAFGQVPVIEDGDVTLSDSNAILVYLATRYDETQSWYPRESERMARVQQWLSVAAGPLADGPGAARRIKVFGAPVDATRAIAAAGQLLAVMDRQLLSQSYLTGVEPTIADIANYTYVAVAHEGDVDLSPFANVRAWLRRIEALPHFVAMPSATVAPA